MRRLPLLALVLLLPACSSGTPGHAPESAGKAAPSLTVGDPAPPLVVSTWLKGDPVSRFEPGTVYVLEFWATWCGPCLQAFPHLNTLAKEHKAGLKVITVTHPDDRGNTLDKVRAFALVGKGSRYDFAFAFCESPDTYEAYMGGTGRTGIPASFVIDKAGKLAFVGHPTELDDVLPRVLAGTWPGLAGAAAVKQADDELEALIKAIGTAELAAADAAKAAGQDAAAAGKAAAVKAAGECFAALAGFEQKHPTKAGRRAYRGQKFEVALQAGRMDDVKALAEGLVADASEVGDVRILNGVRGLLSDKRTNPTRTHAAIAAAAADAILAAEGEGDLNTLIGAVQAYVAAGQESKAAACEIKALDAAARDPKLRAKVEEVLRSVRE